MKRKAVNFPTCYLHKGWNRANIECLNCDLWSQCQLNTVSEFIIVEKKVNKK